MEDNITEINLSDKTIYIIGTAHVSKNSAEQAREAILSIRPQAVCIELDDERLSSITNEQKWKNTDIFTVIKQKKAAYLLVTMIISAYQKRLANSFGISSGEEMIESIRCAEETGAKLITVDRNIKTTFMRLWRKMSFFRKIKLLFGVIFGFLDDEKLTEEDLEAIKSQDMLMNALSEMGQEFPDVKRYIVDERDLYIAQKIRSVKAETIVAVVGAAHVEGIKKNIIQQTDVSDLEIIPKASPVGKVIGWAIPSIIVGMIIMTVIKDFSAGLEQLKQWVLYNGVLSALGTVIAGGHILSVLTAFVCAPITSLNPLLAAGWFAGLTEAYIRKPAVKDFESLSDDLVNLKGLWKNKLTKVLLVVVLANIGSVIGTYVGGFEVFKIFNSLF